MLTQEYKAALEKQKATILKVWKLRFVILAALACIIVACVLLGVAGNVYGESYSRSVKYGEDYSFSAKAIFKDVSHYEYRVRGGEWSEEMPVYAGKYEFRGVSYGLGGKPRYGRARSFEVAPADIRIIITDTSLMYGTAPNFIVEDLMYGDSCEVTDFNYEYDQPTAVAVRADKDSVKIFDRSGNDVTSSYNIIAETKEIFSDSRPITIRTATREWVYDGRPHSDPNFEIVSELGLLRGHKAFVECVELTDAKEIDNEVTRIRIEDERGVDVTAHYDIDYETGKLTVLKRPVTLKTVSDSCVYDGDPHTFASVEYKDGLADGHKFTDYEVTESVSVTDVDGETDNVMTVLPHIEDGNGNDVGENYEVLYDYGKISVTPKPITVLTGSQTFVYNGAKQKCESATVQEGELVRDHRLAVISDGFSEITDTDEIGYTDNDSCFCVYEGDKDVSRNYSITYIYGKIRIKSPIEIAVPSLSKTYDGTPLSFVGNEYSIVKLPPDVDEKWVRATIRGSLVDAGSITLNELRELSEVDVTDDGGRDMLSDGENRVDLVGEEKPLQILPRTIEISSVSIAMVKGDEPLSGNIDDCWRISLGSPVGGHNVSVTVSGRLELDMTQAVNKIDSVSVVDGSGKDVTENYEIIRKEGVLRWL